MLWVEALGEVSGERECRYVSEWRVRDSEALTDADTLAYFALAVDLVLHKGYTVNKDGTLQKLTADKK